MPAQPVEMTLSLNRNNAIVKRLCDGSYNENAEMIAKQVYGLALISQRKLDADEMKAFLENSFDVLSKI